MLLVVVDGLRADHLDHWGYGQPTAQSLDGFRDESVLFLEAHAPAPWTLPSVASLLTGRLPAGPGGHGLLARRHVLDDRWPTLPERLAAAGYRTSALSHHPEVGRERGFARGFDRFRGSPADAARTVPPDASAALPWLREWLAEGPGDPFFLYLHLVNPSGPYRVPAEARSVLLGRPPSAAFDYRQAVAQGLRRRPAPAPATAAQQEAAAEQYDTAVRYTLDRVAELFEMLRRSGRYDDTWIVLTADHGEALLERGRVGHGHTLHREVLHVPLYVKPPGGADGRRVAAPVALVDVAPTILDVLGLPGLEGDGRSLAPSLAGPVEPEPRPIFHHTAFGAPAVSRAVREGRYKLVEIVEPRGARRELYDLSLDPEERHDRSDQGREIAAHLATLLEATLGPRRPLLGGMPTAPETATAP